MRKVPLALPLESSCLSASFRPNLPKYQLEWKKKRIRMIHFQYSGLYSVCMCHCATFNKRQWDELSNIYEISAGEAAVSLRWEACGWVVCVLHLKWKFYSLLSLDGVHRSYVIAGNVTSSTCSERTSLPPVSLAEQRRTASDGGGWRQVGTNREKDHDVHVTQTGTR